MPSWENSVFMSPWWARSCDLLAHGGRAVPVGTGPAPPARAAID
jgi:hypothetical protein